MRFKKIKISFFNRNKEKNIDDKIKERTHKQIQLSIYFGVPGSGKTTLAAYLVKKDLKKGLKVWSNCPITGAYKLDCKEDIGKKMIQNGRIIIDEAGVEYDNRNFKNFSHDETYFYKYHRHYKCPVDILSQDYEDMDKKLRKLAQRIYFVRKSILPFCIEVREIRKRITIDKINHDIVDDYDYVPALFGGLRFIFAPPLWKLFNTYSCRKLEEKVWEKW